MTPRKGNLMSVRDDIKVLDATIRDGGLCNNFEFTDEFVTELYKTNIKSGVVWGYDLQYMMTGQLNRHPREAMAFTAEKRSDYCEFYKQLLDND